MDLQSAYSPDKKENTTHKDNNARTSLCLSLSLENAKADRRVHEQQRERETLDSKAPRTPRVLSRPIKKTPKRNKTKKKRKRKRVCAFWDIQMGYETLNFCVVYCLRFHLRVRGFRKKKIHTRERERERCVLFLSLFSFLFSLSPFFF